MLFATSRRFVVATRCIAILLSGLAILGQPERACGQPAWHTQATIYQVFVEKFSAAKTLQGVEDNLDYLQDLGVNTIWLMPIFEAMDDHGYNTTDYYKIAARYGTKQDLKNLVTSAHGKNIRVILDLVINHTGTLHPWFSSTNAAVRKDHWYVWADRDLGWDDPWNYNPTANHPRKTWFKDPFDGFDRNGDGDSHNDDFYYSVFGDGETVFRDASGNVVGIGGTMPDLNYNDATAKNEIVAEVKQIMDHWLTQTGVDGFRCDAVRYLSEFGVGNQAEQGRTHEVWKELRSWLDVNHPGAILLAEAPTETYAQMRGYYGTGDEFHAAFHFKLQGLLMDAARHGFRQAALMPDLYEIQSHLPTGTQDVLFLSNHDHFTGDRVASQLGEDPAKIKLAGSLYLLLSGNPSIYYGEEIAATGAGGDAQIRQPFDWAAARSQAFDEKSVLNHYKRLLRLRNEYAALRGGITYFAHAHYSSEDRWDNNFAGVSKILTIVREWNGEKILVVHNFGNADERIHVSLDSTSLTFPDTPAYSLMGNAPVEPISATNRNWYNVGTVFPRCSKAVFIGDISAYQNASQHFVTYENALQGGENLVTIHYREPRPSPAYFVHAWNDLGLVANNKMAMTYEGQFNGGHWWSVTMNRMPDQFKFCFVDNENNWDGENREYSMQGPDIFAVAGASNVATTRP